MKLLVCGGRRFGRTHGPWSSAAQKKADREREALFGILNEWHKRRPITCVIQGAASGADWLAAKWAEDNGVTVMRFPADWETHGNAAGHVRNGQMLAEGQPDAVLAFPGGRGTDDMVRKSLAAGVAVARAIMLEDRTIVRKVVPG